MRAGKALSEMSNTKLIFGRENIILGQLQVTEETAFGMLGVAFFDNQRYSLCLAEFDRLLGDAHCRGEHTSHTPCTI